jgi:hypothetical protein
MQVLPCNVASAVTARSQIRGDLTWTGNVLWRNLLARQLAPRDLVAVAGEALPDVLERVPRAERVAFLREMVAASIGPVLRNLGREERAQLMNALLPLAARGFPLVDLDLLTAFPAPISAEGATGP